jgi:hypothetical protein
MQYSVIVVIAIDIARCHALDLYFMQYNAIVVIAIDGSRLV